MEAEKIFEVFWNGPFEWRKGIKDCKEHHVLYQVYGYHPFDAEVSSMLRCRVYTIHR